MNDQMNEAASAETELARAARVDDALADFSAAWQRYESLREIFEGEFRNE